MLTHGKTRLMNTVSPVHREDPGQRILALAGELCAPEDEEHAFCELNPHILHLHSKPINHLWMNARGKGASVFARCIQATISEIVPVLRLMPSMPPPPH